MSGSEPVMVRPSNYNRSAVRSIEAACILAIDCVSAVVAMALHARGKELRLICHILSMGTASSVSNIMCIGE